MCILGENGSSIVPYLLLLLSQGKFMALMPIASFYCTEQTRATRTERRDKNEVFKNKVKVVIVKQELYKRSNLQFW